MPTGFEMDFETLYSYDYVAHRFENQSVGSLSATENTPLLEDLDTVDAPERHYGTPVRDFTSIVMLIVVLLGGISIGAYLLVLQYNQDHLLPPVDKVPVRQVTRSEWDQPESAGILAQPFQAKTVIIEETGTRQCQNLESCAPLLRELKDKFGVNDFLPYNFLLSTDGTAYEGLGWSALSPLYPEEKSLVLAFIGDFTYEVPNIEQVEMTKCLISDFLNRGFLVKNYTVSGNLYEKFKDSPQWIKVGSGLLYPS